MPMAQLLLGEGLGKMTGEFTAVIGEHGLDRLREGGLRQSKELGGGAAGMTGGGQREGEAGV